MIESLLEELPKHGGYDEHDPKRDPPISATASEKSFLASLLIVRRIVTRLRPWGDSAQAADLVQEVACRIWSWRLNHQQKNENMSKGEWNSFAARTAYNEVNRHFSRAPKSVSLSLETVAETAHAAVETETEIEIVSLIAQAWRVICELPLRQRQSLLLHSQDLIIYFLQIGITDEQFADLLNISSVEWNSILGRLARLEKFREERA